MVFPESDRILFRQNPLAEVICQLRFPPILSIAASSPAKFQDRIRTQFPMYEKSQSLGLPSEIAALIEQSIGHGAVQIETVRHNFSTEDGTSIIGLTQDFIALTDKSYSRWEGFRDNLRLAFKALTDEFRPTFYTRVGLRYRDVINKADLGFEDSPWHELIRPSLVGILAEDQISQRVQKTSSETTIHLSDEFQSFAKIRYGIGDTKDIFTIDTDFFTTNRCNGDQVFDALDNFNKVAGNLFRWAILPRLRDGLGADHIDRARGTG